MNFNENYIKQKAASVLGAHQILARQLSTSCDTEAQIFQGLYTHARTHVSIVPVDD